MAISNLHEFKALKKWQTMKIASRFGRRNHRCQFSHLEAKVYLQCYDDALAVRLRNTCEAKVDVDSLHRIFITSQVKIKYGLEYHAPKGQNVKDARIFHLKLVRLIDHPTLCKCCYDVIACQPLSALAAVS
ncbi:hypothetical protein E3N88_27202 [Mikania micrantha]|uniref:Uncharacterized protein n=1 Tax=Mikania micrantha TaxID=192012 RepID=A0A5N6MWN8_9ASTR|nr:hypothetical protein E3N88_27202 [Mikania micrantha]